MGRWSTFHDIVVNNFASVLPLYNLELLFCTLPTYHPSKLSQCQTFKFFVMEEPQFYVGQGRLNVVINKVKIIYYSHYSPLWVSRGDFVPHNHLRLKLIEALPSLLLVLPYQNPTGTWETVMDNVGDMCRTFCGARPGRGNMFTHSMSQNSIVSSSDYMRDWEMGLAMCPEGKLNQFGEHIALSLCIICVWYYRPHGD